MKRRATQKELRSGQSAIWAVAKCAFRAATVSGEIQIQSRRETTRIHLGTISTNSRISWLTGDQHLKAFISYSHRDSAALERLHTHLAVLRREGRIETWYDREILAGGTLDQDINDQLETSELYLLLVSPDFLASSYCYEREMERALERHRAGEARVVPIIIEPCDWNSTALRELKALPRDGKPVSEWMNANNAFLDVVQELRRLADEGSSHPIAPESIHPRATQHTDTRCYRVKRDFDDIDRSDFREQAFDAIRNYFESACVEINGIENLRGRFVSIGPFGFTCTIVNRVRDRGTAHITVHRKNGHVGLADIYYSFSENAPATTAHGGFTIGADEYELFLKPFMSMYEQGDVKLFPLGAATQLWSRFLEQAGVVYE